uniref:Uncharacterized protein n=1 Tax=Cacopsylla melanoneura TaxID=428564 RepID=A0A8D8W543_9HEMI
MFDYSPTPLTPRLILFCVLNSPLLSSSHPLFTPPPPSIPFGLILYLSPPPLFTPTPSLIFTTLSGDAFHNSCIFNLLFKQTPVFFSFCKSLDGRMVFSGLY